MFNKTKYKKLKKQQHRLEEKRELRDLNQRLTMLVRHQREGRSEVNHLKKLLAETEVDFRQKLKDSEKHYQLLQDKFMAENEQLNLHNKTLREQLDTTEKLNTFFPQYFTFVNFVFLFNPKEPVKMLRADMTELELKDKKLQAMQNQLEGLMNELVAVKASVKASSKNDEQLAGQLQEQCDQWKSKFDMTCEELAKIKSRHKCQVDGYQRELNGKSEENEKLKEQLREYVKKGQELQNQIRQEFDTKMTEVLNDLLLYQNNLFFFFFVEKREIQYQSEKEEWMKIFKEEYQKKMTQFKEINAQLVESNKKLESEINDLKLRLTRVRREKAEIDAEKHHLEEELEKARNDTDELRQRKDDELREKTLLVSSLQESLKQKETAFEELSGAKIQLDNEIAVENEGWRDLLCAFVCVLFFIQCPPPSFFKKTEKEAGYVNPLESGRKKRNTDDGNNCSVSTPGLNRARQAARQELQDVGTSTDKNSPNNVRDNEIMEEDEEENGSEEDESEDQENIFDTNNLPRGNITTNPLGSNNHNHKRKYPDQKDVDKTMSSNSESKHNDIDSVWQIEKR
ncbi:condensin, SMC5-subunit [Reticulomyxa filosa]|uniref:Condensin, SMC5-subunit n=1 Tax=Reticulomyxa filosa TaxID=46433 RepID=X6NS29_RETFI|nr:condensin, SMC5-subunit [Reticulomyxa filosa]|eukprot:ETO28743.1 condensin, SMC5-subunit [Reticulomyxa filosa]